MAAQNPLVVAAFLLLATCTQVNLALYGLLARYVQVVSKPSMPALRAVVITNLFGEATLVLFHLIPKYGLAWLRRWRLQRARQQQKQQQQLVLPVHHATKQLYLDHPASKLCSSSSSSSTGTGSDKGSAGGSEAAPHSTGAEGPADAASFPACAVCAVAAPMTCGAEQQRPNEASAAEAGMTAATAAGAPGPQPPPPPPPPAASRSRVRAPVPLVRGLSRRFDRWEQQRPVLHRRLALAAITVTFAGCCSLQLLAPGFVDVSIVQLTTQWTTLGIALAQALLLGHRLPRIFWPCAAVMLGGAAMVIVPSIGQSTAGSLNTARGWWGLVMAMCALLCTVCYYILLQATRHLGFTALQLQHYLNIFTTLFFLALSLPIDGTGWASQFEGWGASDWVVLLVLSGVCYIGSGMLMQVCVWKLGAPTASMFFGLRLVFSVVLSTPILGTTVIQTGVQVAGVVITALAVTAYAASQWWASRQQQRLQLQQAAAAAAESSQAAGQASQAMSNP